MPGYLPIGIDKIVPLFTADGFGGAETGAEQMRNEIHDEDVFTQITLEYTLLSL